MTIREMMAMYHSLQFVEELLDYIEQYPDDDYMTMECLCRKLVKYHLMSKVDGYYIADRKTEPQTNCDTCKYDISEDDYDLYDMCEPMVEGECNYEPKEQTERSE